MGGAFLRKGGAVMGCHEFIVEPDGAVTVIERYCGEVKYINTFSSWGVLLGDATLTYHLQFGSICVHSWCQIPHLVS